VKPKDTAAKNRVANRKIRYSVNSISRAFFLISFLEARIVVTPLVDFIQILPKFPFFDSFLALFYFVSRNVARLKCIIVRKYIDISTLADFD